MQYAARLTTLPSVRSIAAPALALAAGAAIGFGGSALLEDNDSAATPDTVVIQAPAPGEGVRGIEDMARTAGTSGSDQPSAPIVSGIPHRAP